MKHVLIHFKLIFVAAVWGFGWPAGRVLAAEMAPFVAAWTRYVVAIACFEPVARRLLLSKPTLTAS